MLTQTLIQAMITEQTCGDACWHAKEDICRCSCGGRNHGCLRSEDGEQPARTRRIKTAIYQLVAVPVYQPNQAPIAFMRPMEERLYAIEHASVEAGLFDKYDFYSKTYLGKEWPAVLSTATESQIRAWPELASWRDADTRYRPLVLWVRADLLHLDKAH